MPVDPEISLHVTPPAGTNALSGNPIETLNTVGLLQNRLNQNQLFQQEFTAKQRAGQILASSPDMETGLANLWKDPQTAAFAGPIANNARTMQSTMMDIATKEQALKSSGLASTLKLMSGALMNPDTLNDPAALKKAVDAGLMTVSPQARDAVASGITSLVDSLRAGLPSDPAQASAVVKSRAAGILTGVGMTPEALAATAGTTLPSVSVEPMGPQGAPVFVQKGGFGNANVPVNALGGGAPPGQNPLTPNPGGLIGQTPMQQKYNEARGADMADYQKNLDLRVSTGTGLQQVLQEANDALGQIKAGGGASAYAKLATVAQGLGFSDELVNKIGNGSLPASQEFAKLMVQTSLGQLTQQIQGVTGSKINQVEFKSFQENNPNINTDPRAVEKIFNFWTRLYNRDVMEQQRLAQEMQKPGFNISSWPAMWNKIMQDEKMVNPTTTLAGGQRSPPASSSRPSLDSFFGPR